MAFVAIASLACSKENPSEQVPQQAQMATLEVNVSDGITTRATSVKDSQIGTAAGDIQVLVFNSADAYCKLAWLESFLVLRLHRCRLVLVAGHQCCNGGCESEN